MATAISFGNENSGFQIGISNGPVYLPSGKLASKSNKVGYPVLTARQARPETPPNPSSNVPFRRDADFVDRKIILDQVYERCAVPGSWTALVGLGGVG
jgi:hypothetical protein